MISRLRARISRNTARTLQRFLGPATRVVEAIVFGTRVRERLLTALLEQYYRSLWRRLVYYSVEPPHFTHQRIGHFLFGFGREALPIEAFKRGFLSADVIRDGDRLLDIGCGDGFFSKRFFGSRCSRVDGVDVEPAAIEAARRFNAAPNVRYYLIDAVAQPFPEPPYDVVVWDGALGHFAPEMTRTMFAKIVLALASDGAFVGSESLGREGSDHLQFFEAEDDLAKLLTPYFKHVQIKTSIYRLPDGYIRREAYWRCANVQSRLAAAAWRAYDQ